MANLGFLSLKANQFSCLVHLGSWQMSVMELFRENFIKKETLAQVFPCEFCEIFKNTFSAEYLQTTTSVSLRNQNSLKNITKIHLTNTPDSGL